MNINILLIGIIFLLFGGIFQVLTHNPIFKLCKKLLVKIANFCYVISIILNGTVIIWGLLILL